MKKPKKELKAKSKWSKVIWIGCVLYYTLTFVFDKLTIEFNHLSLGHFINYFLIKILVLLVILAIGYFFNQTLTNKDYQKYFKYFLIYFIPMIIVLILIWPGNWYGADIEGFLLDVRTVGISTHLYYLTSVFYSLGMSLFPSISGAIVFQLIIMSAVVAYIVKNAFDYFKGNKLCYLLYLPFFLPVIIFYNMYVNRPITYGILYLLFIAICLFDNLNQKKLTLKKLLFLSVLIAIVCNWRSEAFYLILAAPIIVLVTYRVKLNWKNVGSVFAAIIIIIIITIAAIPQKILTLNQDYITKTDRNLPIYINPLSVMLTKDLKGEHLNDNLAKINKVLNIKSLKKYSNQWDTPCYWAKDSCVNKKYTAKEYKEFQKAYISLISENPRAFFEARYATFRSGSRLENDFTAFNIKPKIYNDNFVIKRILPEKVRNLTVRLIEGRRNGDETIHPIYRYTMNIYIPIIGLGILFLYALFKKNWLLFLITGMMGGHVLILFLTAPAAYFMYYYNVYLIGMFLISFYCLNILIKLKTLDKKNFSNKIKSSNGE